MDGQVMTKATDETERLEREIGARIDAAVKAADPRTPADIASLIGINLDSLNKDSARKEQHPLCQARANGGNPPPEPKPSARIRQWRAGIDQRSPGGAFEGLGHPSSEAQKLSGIVLKVIDTPEAGDRSQNPRERARLIAKFLTQEFVREHPAGSAGGAQ
jgi:hypothetical protein